MDVQTYLRRKQLLKSREPRFRSLCPACLQMEGWCYCDQIAPIDCGIKFVILLHPLERRRRIATGRMSHLILQDSEIIHGNSFTKDQRVNEIVADPRYFPVVLHLDPTATHIDKISDSEKIKFCPPDKKLVVFVVDGTWGTASKTVRRSKNLSELPFIAFTPNHPSLFRVRQQPNQLCYSTIEAIHQTIDLFGNTFGYDSRTRQHAQLLRVFDYFVSKQIKCVEDIKRKFGKLQYRKKIA